MTLDVPSLPSSSSKITLDNSEPSRLFHPDHEILVPTAASQRFAAAGSLPGDSLKPLSDLDSLDDLPKPTAAQARFVLDRLVVVKLNGGLGTSMGLSGPKSLVAVKNGRSFLDILATQVLALREHHQARLPLLLMNS